MIHLNAQCAFTSFWLPDCSTLHRAVTPTGRKQVPGETPPGAAVDT